MQKVKKYQRQILATFLALATALTCFLIMSPKAGAAVGDYYWKVYFRCVDDFDMENSAATVYVNYITNNGTGTQITNQSSSSFSVEKNTWKKQESTDLGTFIGQCPGFPYQVILSGIKNSNELLPAHIHYELFVSKDGSAWKWIGGHQEGNYDDYQDLPAYLGRLDDINVDKAYYPYVAESAITPSEVLIPTDGSTSEKNERLSITAFDQYGVEWVDAPTKNSPAAADGAPLPTVNSTTTKTPNVTFKNHSKDYKATFTTTWGSANSDRSPSTSVSA